jgi:hypothetical protein
MLKLTIHKLGDTIVFRCTGRIVFGECHILRHAIFSHPYITIAVLDMAQVTALELNASRGESAEHDPCDADI